MNDSDWQLELITRLAATVPCGYMVNGEPASEPTALAGLALLAHEQVAPALSAAHWLAKRQAHDGAIGVAANRAMPAWATAWAILLWNAVAALDPSDAVRRAIDRATAWSLTHHGDAIPRSTAFGHDSTLVGWSWASHTHSWIEPTAMFVLALKAIGQTHHTRTREAVRLLVDRLLPDGGCNYGNTIVLGQTLLPHLQPTGLTMMALAGETTTDPRIERSLVYLANELSADTATASLCFGLLGLAAHHRAPADRDRRLQCAYERVQKQGGSPYKLALLALAARGIHA